MSFQKIGKAAVIGKPFAIDASQKPKPVTEKEVEQAIKEAEELAKTLDTRP